VLKRLISVLVLEIQRAKREMEELRNLIKPVSSQLKLSLNVIL
jgi:hypothetical protein